MSDTKFTPGPWQVEDGSLPINVETVSGACICDVWEFAVGDDEPAANAHLIAAAPDMYAEHKQWAEQFGHALMAVMQEDYSPITELAMQMPFDFHEGGSSTLRSAALAKAEGKS